MKPRVPVERLPDLGRAAEGAQRHHAAAERLRQAEDVRLDAVVLDREELPGPAEAGLDLVRDEERAALRAEPPNAGDVVVGREDHAALALDRLQDNGGGLI